MFIFRAGEKVRHPLFGAGEVERVAGGAYFVRFESVKTRSISVSPTILIPYYPPKN